MFSKETYINRRARLKELVGHGIILLFGNNEAPCNYPANAYYPFRQDSSFLYYFGQQRDGLVGVIDIDQNEETLIGDDIDIEDIVWYGSVDSVSDMAAQVGVAHSAPMRHLQELCDEARRQGRALHFLPPYRHDIKIQLHDLLGIHPREQKAAASMTLIKAVVAMRSVKEPQEIEALERAATIGYKMHTTAMRLTRPGVTEKFVGGQVDGIAHSYGAQVSFATIFSQHGEIMHGNPSMALLEDGRLALCDCGAETVDHYVIRTPQSVKPALLKAVLEEKGFFRVIVFARTRSRADTACRRLRREGYAVEAIHSDRSQNQRRRALDKFASGEVNIITATDVLARGIDVEEVDYVINYDAPEQAEDYVHRIGRTGRAGKCGYGHSSGDRQRRLQHPQYAERQGPGAVSDGVHDPGSRSYYGKPQGDS